MTLDGRVVQPERVLYAVVVESVTDGVIAVLGPYGAREAVAVVVELRRERNGQLVSALPLRRDVEPDVGPVNGTPRA